MATYTVKDEESGRVITFEWNGEEQPNDSDLQEVFAAAQKQDAVVPADTGGFIETLSSEEQLYSPTESIKNLPSSGMEYGKDMGRLAHRLVTNPKGVAETFGKIGSGVVEKVSGSKKDTDALRMVNAIGRGVKERYGGANLFRTLEKDPVGVAADASTILMGAGGLTKVAGKATGLKSLSEAGKDIAKIGTATEPLSLLKSGAGKAAKSLISENYAANSFKKAVKFSKTLTPEKRNKLVKTALDLGIMPTEKGVERLQGLIDATDSTIANMISEAGKSGSQIPAQRLHKYFGDALKKSNYYSGLPISARESVKGVIGQWMQRLKEGKRTYTPQEAQTIKKNIYKDLRSKYASTKYDSASVMTQKGIARGVKESLEEILPEIKELNKNDGDYIELLEAISRSANRISDSYAISLRGGAAIGTGALAGGQIGGKAGAGIGTALGALWTVYDQPIVRSKLAIIANKLKKQGVKLDPKSAAIRLGLVNTGKLLDTKTKNVKNITDDNLKDILGEDNG